MNDELLEKVMAALSKASATHEFIGLCATKETANFKAKGKTKTFHYRVFTESEEPDTKGHVELFVKKEPIIIEF